MKRCLLILLLLSTPASAQVQDFRDFYKENYSQYKEKPHEQLYLPHDGLIEAPNYPHSTNQQPEPPIFDPYHGLHKDPYYDDDYWSR